VIDSPGKPGLFLTFGERTMNAQTLVEYAMTLDVGPALAVLVSVYGKDSRVYTVTFDDDGKWNISVKSADTGKTFARFAKDLE
jgi:hypothetical protein